MAEVLLYGVVWSETAREFIENVNASGDQDLTVRVNGDGGELMYGWGCITKLAQLENVKLINDGEANSMFAFAFCYGKDNEAADYSTFTFHRAGYASWIEKDPSLFTEADRADLTQKNSFLRKAFEARVDSQKFKEETDVSVDQLFSLDGRIDVKLSAKQAKKVGLIDRIISVTPQRRMQINAMKERIEARMPEKTIAAKSEIIMNIDTLKNEHPSLYAQVFALGKKAGEDEEFDRVQACLTFNDIDPKGVTAAVESRKPLSAKQMAEFTRKAVSAEAVKTLEADSQEAGKTQTSEAGTAGEADKKATALTEFVKNVKAQSLTLK